MSIRDAKLIFAEDMALGSVGANVSTNIIDLGIGKDAFDAAVNSNPGQGGQNFLNIVMTASAAATGGAAEAQWDLFECDTLGGSYTKTPIGTKAISKATLVKGYVVVSQSLPATLQEFLELKCTVTTNNFTSGTYSAWIGNNPIQDK
jgi:hypothetical protein